MKETKEKTIDNYGVTVLYEYIWEVSLEEMGQFAFEYDIKAVSYEKTEKGEMLVVFLLRTKDEILENGVFVTRSILTTILYTPVKEYKRLLVYDHPKKIIKYTDDDSAHTYDTTNIFVVTNYPHFMNKIVIEFILEKMEGNIRK